MPTKNKIKAKENLIGAWAFLIGVILAIIIGLFKVQLVGAASTVILALLVILGLIVGFLNVGDKDVHTFLLAALALVIVSYMGSESLAIIPQLGSILNALLILFIPATVIVSLKLVFSIAKS
jgi:signal transduction histidine kinase